MRGFLCGIVLVCGCVQSPRALTAEQRQTTLVALENQLDAFHLAASEADGERYFGLFASDGIFIGTDATERWCVQEFETYARPYFDAGRGWTYEPIERHLSLAPSGELAWFDERLRNEHYGEARGSGVWLREEDNWRLAQYNLCFPIPNALADTVVALIRESEAAAGDQP